MHKAYGHLLAGLLWFLFGSGNGSGYLALALATNERLTRHVHVTMSGKLPAVSNACPSVLSGLKRINNCVCDMECFFRPSVKGPVVGKISLPASLAMSGADCRSISAAAGSKVRCPYADNPSQELFVAHWLIMEKLLDVFLVSVSRWCSSVPGSDFSSFTFLHCITQLQEKHLSRI